MANDYFQFKSFTIYQNRTAMKVGTDGVLLGAWTSAPHSGRILDIGTGTGLIAIMMAQRSRARITALEIENSAFHQAGENIKRCPWHDRIELLHQSFQQFYENHQGKFDLILSNPPWFQERYLSPCAARNKARHNAILPYQELLKGSQKLLKPEGEFSLILPYRETEKFINQAEALSLYCKKRMNVHANPHKAPKRCMLEMGLEPGERKEETLTIEAGGRHHFTPAYRHLTKDFYLFF